jgi:hypothetical protein
MAYIPHRVTSSSTNSSPDLSGYYTSTQVDTLVNSIAPNKKVFIAYISQAGSSNPIIDLVLANTFEASFAIGFVKVDQGQYLITLTGGGSTSFSSPNSKKWAFQFILRNVDAPGSASIVDVSSTQKYLKVYNVDDGLFDGWNAILTIERYN